MKALRFSALFLALALFSAITAFAHKPVGASNSFSANSSNQVYNTQNDIDAWDVKTAGNYKWNVTVTSGNAGDFELWQWKAAPLYPDVKKSSATNTTTVRNTGISLAIDDYYFKAFWKSGSNMTGTTVLFS